MCQCNQIGGTDMTKIKGFNGQYRFLSNFYPCTITYNGVVYRSVEAAYQAQKNPKYATQFAKMDAIEAKRAGSRMKLRPDWDDVKLSIMNELIVIKFTSNKSLCQKLLGTANLILEETNYWNDTYWGVCNGVGENHLGKILMKVREQLRNKAIHDSYHGRSDL